MTSDQARRKVRIFLGFPMADFEDRAGVRGLTPAQESLVSECVENMLADRPWLTDDVRRRAAELYDPLHQTINAAVLAEMTRRDAMWEGKLRAAVAEERKRILDIFEDERVWESRSSYGEAVRRAEAGSLAVEGEGPLAT